MALNSNENKLLYMNTNNNTSIEAKQDELAADQIVDDTFEQYRFANAREYAKACVIAGRQSLRAQFTQPRGMKRVEDGLPELNTQCLVMEADGTVQVCN